MPYIDVRYHFVTEEEEDYTHYELVSIERTGTDIPAEAMENLGDVLAQSDRYVVGGANAAMDALTSSKPGPKMIKEYW